MPFAVGAPVARMSTMIIDADLNMGAFTVKTDEISEATPGSKVTLASDLDMGAFTVKTDEISEATPGSKVTLASDLKVSKIREAVLNEGVIIPELSTAVIGPSAIPSDRIRYTDSGEVSTTSELYVLAKEMYVPAVYLDGSVIRIRSTLHSTGGYTASMQIRVNDTVVSGHTTKSDTYQTFYDDITVKGGDKVATWIKAEKTSAGAYTHALELRCDDVFINHVKNSEWR